MSYQKLAAWFVLLCVPVCVLGALRLESNMEDVFQWLPDESEDRTVYNRLVEYFGSDDFIVVSWPGCSLASAECDRLVDAIKQTDERGLITEAVSGRQVLSELARLDFLSAKQIIQRFESIYFGPDHRQTCLIVSLTKYGMMHRRDAIAHVRSTAEQTLGDAYEHLVLAGYPYVGAYGDQIIRWSITRLVWPSCLISTVVAWFCLGSLRLTIVTLGVAGLAAFLSVAIVTLTGAMWGGLSSAIPTLTYILTVSGTLHLINYARSCPRERLALAVLRIGWRPCFVSGMTTAAGVLSLCRSSFPAVRQFGVYCAAGVLAALVCQLLLVPPALELLRRDVRQPGKTAWQDGLLVWVLRSHRRLAVSILAGVCCLAAGLYWLTADLEVERHFSKRSAVIQDIAWLENALGPVEQTELVLTFDQTDKSNFHDRLAVVRAVQSGITELPSVHASFSLANSLPSPPSKHGLRATMARVAYRSALRQSRDKLKTSAYLSDHRGQESWRISIRIPFLGKTDFAALAGAVTTRANQLIREQTHAPEVWYTGVSHMYHVAQGDVIEDLYRNFAMAFALICPMMILAVHSVPLGVLAMIPNVCPAVVVFGGLGWLGFPLDIGMAMTACVALGIAVDDTTHLLVRFRDAATELDPRSALRIAFRQCASAMSQTTLIAGLGLVAFMVGPLVALTRFAAMLIALLVVALLCDLVLLPALLKRWNFVGEQRTAVVPTARSGECS